MSAADYVMETLRSTTVALENAGDIQIIRRGSTHRVVAQFTPDNFEAAREAMDAFNRLEQAKAKLRSLAVETTEDKLVGALRGIMPTASRNTEEFFEAQTLLFIIEEDEK